jgi:hypothetical protein
LWVASFWKNHYLLGFNIFQIWRWITLFFLFLISSHHTIFFGVSFSGRIRPIVYPYDTKVPRWRWITLFFVFLLSSHHERLGALLHNLWITKKDLRYYSSKTSKALLHIILFENNLSNFIWILNVWSWSDV